MNSLLDIFKFCAKLLVIIKDIVLRLKYWGLQVAQEQKEYKMCKVAWNKITKDDWGDKHPPIE